METIFALASARGKSGVAVVRLSGSMVMDCVRSIARRIPEPRVATYCRLVHRGIFLDEALVLFFPGPNSFTGEDVAEFHLHGSIATVNAVLEALADFPDVRLAEPGEFTRRALENDKLDLSQVEGLSDLIESETEAQRRQALRVLSGELGRRASAWRDDLIRAAALLAATIDFVDEEVPVDVTPEVLALVEGVLGALEAEVAGAKAAERIREGFEVAIVGPPNVGKSTLLNALAGREAAITSEVEGTTRDVIEVRMEIRGLPVTVLDTAGIRSTDDRIESLGIERARSRAEDADLRVILSANEHDRPIIDPRKGDFVLVSKADLGNGDISGLTGFGVEEFIDRLAQELEKRAAGAGLAIRERHRLAMQRAIGALNLSREQLTSIEGMTEFAAEELRVAVVALDSLVGRVDVEHILGEIFSRFCIGK